MFQANTIPFIYVSFLFTNVHPMILMLPCQNKQHFKRFMESVLQKSVKFKKLQRELKDNYTAESASS